MISVENDKHSSRTFTTRERIEKVQRLMMENHQITIRETVRGIGISFSSVQPTDDLGIWRVF